MPRTLDRYLVRELFVPFLIGTVAVVLMFQGNLLIFQLKTFRLQSIPAEALFQVILLKTPFFLNMTLPVGMALASAMAMSRLARESELTAMRAAGIPVLRVVMPIALFGALVAGGNFYLVERVMPASEQQARKLLTELAILGAAPDFKSNVVVNLRNYTASFGTVSRGGGGTIHLTDILMIERPRTGEVVLYRAKNGQYDNGIWRIDQPIGWWMKDDQLMAFKPLKEDMLVNERIELQDFFMERQPQEQTAADLKKAIQDGRKQGRDMTSAEIAYFLRFAVPFACMVFAISGPMFSVVLYRSGAFVGVLISLIQVLVYYNVQVIATEIFGQNGWISPWLAAWLPNIIFFVLGAIALRRTE